MISIQALGRKYSVIFCDEKFIELKSSEYQLCLVDKKMRASRDLIIKSENVLEVECLENLKNLETVIWILEKFSELRLHRGSKILCIGGGILQDLTTIAASLYMRGICWDFVPSTLQAMGDSCVGGKSAINLRSQKNLIGNYYPPQDIFISPSLLSTLKVTDLQCGLVEMLKINIMSDAIDLQKNIDEFSVFHFGNITEMNYQDIHEIIERTLKIKAKIVEVDEFDLASRKLLNFGHTFGHAIESISNFEIQHGHAVAIGMICAIEFSRLMKGIRISPIFDKISSIVSNFMSPNQKVEFVQFLKNIDFQIFASILRTDKKSSNDSVVLILPSGSSLDIFNFKLDEAFMDTLEQSIQNVIVNLGDKYEIL